MRPFPIRMFEWCFLGSLAVSLIGSLLVWPALVFQVAMALGTVELGPLAIDAIVMAGLVAGTAVTLLLWYFIARRGSVVAKWLLMLFVAYNVWTQLDAGIEDRLTKLSGLLSIAGVALQVLAAAMLFAPAARAWFRDEVEEENW